MKIKVIQGYNDRLLIRTLEEPARELVFDGRARRRTITAAPFVKGEPYGFTLSKPVEARRAFNAVEVKRALALAPVIAELRDEITIDDPIGLFPVLTPKCRKKRRKSA